MQAVPPVVIGRGWLGSATAEALATTPLARRTFDSSTPLPVGAAVLIASGRSQIRAAEAARDAVACELQHLSAVLDACEAARSRRVVVIGSADVAGLATRVNGRTVCDPQTVYAIAKAAVEKECLRRQELGLDITVVRLAPVHGPGKAQTDRLLQVAALPAIPVPNRGRHSIGFI